MTESDTYIVCLRYAGIDRYTLWQTKDDKDTFVLDESNKSVLAAGTEIDLREVAKDAGKIVSQRQPHSVDFDRVDRVVRIARIGRPVSKKSSLALLDAWNILADLAYTLKDESIFIEDIASKQIYEKLFFGANLPATTPSNVTYQPQLTASERRFLVDIFRPAMKRLLEKSRVFDIASNSHK